MDKAPNTIIESMGVYVPQNSSSTEQILQACQKPLNFPLERITGIKNRPTAGKNEFSIHLAKKAISNCLETSKYNAEEIDLLICCNISRYDAPDHFSFEPCTAAKLKKHFGFHQAMAFDITNACAGMFTGVYIVDNFLKTGAIRCGMVVSGEYITHLTRTAEREIENFMDSRLACLTLGDSGAAVILENGEDEQSGFVDMDLQTFGRYSQYCIAKTAETNGWIMYTDAVRLADVAIKSGADYALRILQRAGWPPDSFQHLIMHQTSKMTLNGAQKEIQSLLNDNIFEKVNSINNLENRGNTASTSHFVALADFIQKGEIKSGDKIVFSVSASGLTVGVLLYVFDNLPDRLRKATPALASPPEAGNHRIIYKKSSVRIESTGTIIEQSVEEKDSLRMLEAAAKNCLEKSSYKSNEIDLLLYCGVYRTDYILEPAYATLLAGALNMNAIPADDSENKTLAFDIFNGAVGFLNACHIAQQMIATGKCQSAMIVTAEVENNAKWFPSELLGIREIASAIILDTATPTSGGFSDFLFKHHTNLNHSYTTYCTTIGSEAQLRIEKSKDLEELYLNKIPSAIEELLQASDLSLNEIDLVFPPQISSNFIANLSKAMNFPIEQFVNVAGDGPDLFTSSLTFAFEHAFENEHINPGTVALIIVVGSGIQVGCSIYHF